MVYTNQAITVVDIQFKTVINVLRKKQDYKKKSSTLRPDIVWKLREGFPKGTISSEAMNVQCWFFRCREQHVQSVVQENPTATQLGWTRQRGIGTKGLEEYTALYPEGRKIFPQFKQLNGTITFKFRNIYSSTVQARIRE